MITYLIDVSLAWIFFLLIYFGFLKGQTFFRLNRYFLMSSLWLGLIIPLVRFFSFEILQATPVVLTQPIEVIEIGTTAIVSYVQPETVFSTFSWSQCVLIIYILGVFFFSVRMIIGLLKIWKKRNAARVEVKENYSLVISKEEHLPFSFFSQIFISEDFKNHESFTNILEHELSHVKGRHSYDVLLIELLTIVFWWNPIVYIYKKSIRQTHEFIADSYASRFTDKKNYGHVLLGQYSSGIEYALSNQFFNSHLKKRVMMLSKKKSAGYRKISYLLIIPIVGFLGILFSFNGITDQNDPPLSLIEEIDSKIALSLYTNLTTRGPNNEQDLLGAYKELSENPDYKDHKDYIIKRLEEGGLRYKFDVRIDDDGSTICIGSGDLNTPQLKHSSSPPEALIKELDELITYKLYERMGKGEIEFDIDRRTDKESSVMACYKYLMSIPEYVPYEVYIDDRLEKGGEQYGLNVNLYDHNGGKGLTSAPQDYSKKKEIDNEKEISNKTDNKEQKKKEKMRTPANEIKTKSGLLLESKTDHNGILEEGKGYLFILKNAKNKPNWIPQIELSNSEIGDLKFVDGYSNNEYIHFLLFVNEISHEKNTIILTCSEGQDKITEEFEIKSATTEKKSYKKYVSGESLLPSHLSNALWIINGEISDSKEMHYFSANKIKLEKILDVDEAVKKYGVRAINGAVEVTLEKD